MSNERLTLSIAAATAVLAIALSGCQSSGPRASAPAASATPAAAPAPRAAPGMNASGEVTDSKLVEGGHGRKVKGLNNWEGEITGKAGKDTSFNKLEIGMPMRQVIDLIGPPTDQGAYVTGKAFIPFYFGSDRYRHEMVYRGRGRLIFAGGGPGNYTSGNLIWVIHYPNEGGYR